MSKPTLLALALLLVSCDQGTLTNTCSRACREALRSMDRWNAKDGCVCGAPIGVLGVLPAPAASASR
jgi:hypothetical protein